MTYSATFGIALSASDTGLTLEAQLIDTTGANVGTAITTGFVEIGLGNYMWSGTAIPDGHRGGVKFSLSPGGALKAFSAINPEELENTDAKITTRATPAQVNAEVLDVMSVDTIAELGGVPAAAPTPFQAMMLPYMALRNKQLSNKTPGQVLIHDDSGAVIATATQSDSGTVYTRDKFA